MVTNYFKQLDNRITILKCLGGIPISILYEILSVGNYIFAIRKSCEGVKAI